MRRGRHVLEAWEKRLLEQRESGHVTARCAWCGWELAGTVRDTRDAYREHRDTDHPEVKVKPRRARHRPHRQYASETNLDDNIANARAEGAALWAAPQ